MLSECLVHETLADLNVQVGGRSLPLGRLVEDLLVRGDDAAVRRQAWHWADWCRLVGEDAMARLLDGLAELCRGDDVGTIRRAHLTLLAELAGLDPHDVLPFVDRVSPA